MLTVQTVAGLVVGIVNVDVTAGSQLVVGSEPRHLLLVGIVPYGGVGSAVGTGNSLDLLLIHQPVSQLGAVTSIVVEVLVVVLSPVTMETGVENDEVVGTDLEAILIESLLNILGGNDVPDSALLIGGLCPLAHLCGVAACCVECLLELVVHPGQVNDNAGADSVLQGHLSEGVAVTLAINLFLVEGVVGGVAVGTGMESTGVGAGSLVETLEVLAAGELQVRTCAGEGPQGGVPAPGLAEVPDLSHLLGFEVKLALVKGHVCHDNFLL